MLQRRTLIQASLAVATVAGLAGFAEIAKLIEPGEADGWNSIAWPFPRDGWPSGRAWRGHELEVYVRPKLGFCGNCETGVVSDEEVDRVTDIDLLDERFVALREGQRVRLTDLFGRARLYRLKTAKGERLAEAIAVSYDCDLIVAIVIGNVAEEATRKMAHAFLESNKVQVWLNRQLEGR
jgi:hypothetical protein